LRQAAACVNVIWYGRLAPDTPVPGRCVRKLPILSQFWEPAVNLAGFFRFGLYTHPLVQYRD